MITPVLRRKLRTAAHILKLLTNDGLCQDENMELHFIATRSFVVIAEVADHVGMPLMQFELKPRQCVQPVSRLLGWTSLV